MSLKSLSKRTKRAYEFQMGSKSEDYNSLDSKTTTMNRGNSKRNWVFETFKRKECGRFIASPINDRKCCCGRDKELHNIDALLPPIVQDTKWVPTRHTVTLPTDAFGELEFQGAGQPSRAKYIRLAHDTDPELVLRLLCGEWALDLPKLLISVTGGAKNFILSPKIKRVLREGLLKAAQTTGAWVITGGTNTGVMRHVGEAVKGHTVMSRGEQLKNTAHQVHLIGIASWGIVDHKEMLVNPKEVVPYQMTSSMQSRGACLDNNHSHFILVDNGTDGEYGGEISFRASLENLIASKKMARSCEKFHGVPVVLLVLEGGPNTIRTVLESVSRCPAVPVVIAEGSGRAADILAFAHRFIAPSNGEMSGVADVVEHRQLLHKIEKSFAECSPEDRLSIYQNVLKCVAKREFVTIFCVDDGGLEVDKAILRALLKSQHSQLEDQLSLALVWDRADIAKTEIFTEDQKWEVPMLETAMMEALLHDRVEFVDLLLDNGVSMANFLTVKRLEELYRKNAFTSNTLRFLLNESKGCPGFKLSDLCHVTNRLLGVTFQRMECQSALETSLGILHGRVSLGDQSKVSTRFKCPYNELLIWAVLCNRHKMALYMWERGEETLVKALVAGYLYRQIACLASRDELMADLSHELTQQSKEFYDIALGLLDECYKANDVLAQRLLIYHPVYWGGRTSLSLAVASRHEEFVAHSCCQKKLTEIWMGALKTGYNGSLKVLLGILFPPLIFALEFRSREEMQRVPTTDDDSADDLPPDFDPYHHREPGSAQYNDGYLGDGVAFVKNRKSSGNEEEPIVEIRSDYPCNRHTKLGLGKRIIGFYNAPITKFWSNLIVYLLFLVVFSHVILIELPPVPSIEEWVLIGFVFSLCAEEVRQFFESSDWASNVWNLCDGFAMVLFFLAVGLRLNPGTLRIGHLVYSLDIMLWIIRLLDIFSVSKDLGPYVVMIGRMTIDMMYFLVIMVVFLLAYGVAQQAILFPHEKPSWELITKIFFRPYFQVYGELFIEDVDYSSNSRETAFSTPKFDEYGGRLVTVIMAFYLLVANILLLNLLIAIFNNTFSEVQANSNQIWKFQRFSLVMEYRQRPRLVPPFILIAHAHGLAKAIWKRACGAPASRQADCKFKLFLGKEEYHKLMLFEEQCTETFLKRKALAFNATQEERVRGIVDKVESIAAGLQEVIKATHALEGRHTRQEEYTLQILDVVGHLQLSLPKGMGSLCDPEEDRYSDVPLNPSTDLYARGTSYGGYELLDGNPAPSRFSRMLSMPEYMNQSNMVPSPQQQSPPMYFRKKLPLTNPYQYRKQFTSNNRKGSVQKAVWKFKRRHTLPRPISDALEGEETGSDRISDFLDGSETNISARSRSLNRAESEETTSHSTVEVPVRPRSTSLPPGLRNPAVYLKPGRDHNLHIRARQTPYPKSTQQRYPVPDFLVDWQMPFPGYFPDTYSDPSVAAQPPWADIDLLDVSYLDIQLRFNSIDDDGVDRRSHMGVYDLFDGLPRNPMGRTGLIGRGLLGRWGPNHAADPIVTRWKRNPDTGQPLVLAGKRVLEFVAIQRSDTKEWAIPGGMMEVGDTISKTLKKEFFEEALCSLEESEEEREKMEAKLHTFFSQGIEVYKGYVDDPRNTDNAWIETVALNFHDETGDILQSVTLKAGDDACGVRWQEVSSHNVLYANHLHILQRVAQQHKAFF
ncbi:transient receptor potential cation channel subfamily M member 7 isoform X3 [Nematostella vectensis]|uniref:transient receptor potential cation channel subfamily M member 7 isoform X3 n=1 Tax=Nematostella vectensis TaxID=45351 RepID=UPI0020773EA6|nr:transient receptor potential cation channel subfamily M member 7 isoform X3 [Nematostella vectensis]